MAVKYVICSLYKNKLLYSKSDYRKQELMGWHSYWIVRTRIRGPLFELAGSSSSEFDRIPTE